MFARCRLFVHWRCRTSFWIRTRWCLSRNPHTRRQRKEWRAGRQGSCRVESDFACWLWSWKIPCANGLAQLLESKHVIREGLAIRELVGAVQGFLAAGGGDALLLGNKVGT